MCSRLFNFLTEYIHPPIPAGRGMNVSEYMFCSCLSSSLSNQSSYLVVEVFGFEEFLQGEVHAVAPVVI